MSVVGPYEWAAHPPAPFPARGVASTAPIQRDIWGGLVALEAVDLGPERGPLGGIRAGGLG